MNQKDAEKTIDRILTLVELLNVTDNEWFYHDEQLERLVTVVMLNLSMSVDHDPVKMISILLRTLKRVNQLGISALKNEFGIK